MIQAIGAGKDTSKITLFNNAGITFVNGAVINVGALTAKTSTSGLNVNGLQVKNGNLNLETTTGDIKVNGIKFDKKGDVLLNTTSGQITLGAISNAKDISATAAGDIIIKSTPITVGGQRIDGVTADYIKLNSTNGNEIKIVGVIKTGKDFIVEIPKNVTVEESTIRTTNGKFYIKNAIDTKITNSDINNVEFENVKKVNAENSNLQNINMERGELNLVNTDISTSGNFTNTKLTSQANNKSTVKKLNNITLTGGNLTVKGTSRPGAGTAIYGKMTQSIDNLVTDNTTININNVDIIKATVKKGSGLIKNSQLKEINISDASMKIDNSTIHDNINMIGSELNLENSIIKTKGNFTDTKVTIYNRWEDRFFNNINITGGILNVTGVRVNVNNLIGNGAKLSFKNTLLNNIEVNQGSFSTTNTSLNGKGILNQTNILGQHDVIATNYDSQKAKILT